MTERPRLRPFVSLTGASRVPVRPSAGPLSNETLITKQPALRASAEYQRFDEQSRERDYTLAEVIELNEDNPGNAPSSSSDWVEITVKIPSHTERKYMLRRPDGYPNNRYESQSRVRNYTLDEMNQLKQDNPGGAPTDWREITVDVPTQSVKRYVLRRPARYPNNRYIATYIPDLLPEDIAVESIPIFMTRARQVRGATSARYAGPVPPPVSTTRYVPGTHVQPTVHGMPSIPGRLPVPSLRSESNQIPSRPPLPSISGRLPPLRSEPNQIPSRPPLPSIGGRPVLPPLRTRPIEEGMTVAASSSGGSRREYPSRLPILPAAPSLTRIPTLASRLPPPPVRSTRLPSRIPLPPSLSRVRPAPIREYEEEEWESIPEGYDFS